VGFGDEVTPAIQEVFDQVAEQGAAVPGLWRLEVANSLTMAARRGRIDPPFRAAALDDLAVLDIAVDAETDARAWRETLDLAERHRLSLYDAAYLERPLRLRLPLATLDADLRAAARAEGVDTRGGADAAR
jgi:predicted nucleic acid-binding protein